MNSPSPTEAPTSRPRRPRSRQAVGFLAASLLLPAAGWIALSLRPHSPSEPVEVLRSELVQLDGRLCLRNADVPFTGVMIEVYPDGSPKTRSRLREGRLEGPSTGFYPDGEVQVQEMFVEGVSHGARIKWHPNGVKASEAVIRDGQLHGLFRRWYENGVLAEEIEMRHNQPDGQASIYYPSGFLKVRARTSKGEVVDRTTWSDGETQG